MTSSCPHCHRKVVPRANGHCPACHEDTTKPSSTAGTKARILVSEKTKYPSICCLCASPTSRLSKVSVSGQIATGPASGQGSAPIGAALFAFFIGILGHVIFLHWGSGKRSHRSEESLAIRIPHCKDCAREQRIEPDAIDLEHYQIALIVHRDFAEQVH